MGALLPASAPAAGLRRARILPRSPAAYHSRAPLKPEQIRHGQVDWKCSSEESLPLSLPDRADQTAPDTEETGAQPRARGDALL